jgi:NAD(P)-dependent dehydrogenase (short-subunit alcohol dehydrogenase family)
VNPSYDFAGRVAFVTGASSGMGLATVRAFAEAGAAVTLADISTDALAAAETELREAGHRVLGVRCDVTDEDQVAAAVANTVETFGSLDMAYNNAGIQSPATDAADEPAEVFDRVNAINLRGIWASMKHELAHMRTQGSGAIVNCSSLGGLVGLPGRVAYHASKHGVIGLTRSAALEYAPRGIRINAICPGTIETPMVTQMMESGDLDRDEAAANQPIGRLRTAEEMAAAVLWLCSPGASFVVGVALPVDGGYTARYLTHPRRRTARGAVAGAAASGRETSSVTPGPRSQRHRHRALQTPAEHATAHASTIERSHLHAWSPHVRPRRRTRRGPPRSRHHRPHRRDHPDQRHLHMRIGPVALPRHRGNHQPRADGA